MFGVSLCVGCLSKPGTSRPEGARLVGVSKGPRDGHVLLPSLMSGHDRRLEAVLI